MEIINMGGQSSSADFGQFSLGVYIFYKKSSEMNGESLEIGLLSS